MLEVHDVSLGYDTALVVNGVSLRLAAGEIGCLLGPSGCGKTTLLRAIGGFEPVRSGHIRLQGTLVSEPGRCLPPQHRDIGMVFQDHALFPHLTIAGNVGFGLHRLPKAERAGRVQDMLALVGLQGLGDRYPHALSGGQQQRVALARALAPRPRLLLMDEPFSSLDVGLRESIAREVRSILKQAHATALMVTHDQNEAFAMADSIGVMAQGQLLQWGTAQEIYRHPANPQVAQFVGDGVLLQARRQADGHWHTALGPVAASHAHYPCGDGQSQILLRPEHVTLGPGGVRAKVLECTFRGSHFYYALETEGGERLSAWAGLGEVHAPGAAVGVALQVHCRPGAAPGPGAAAPGAR